MADIDKRLRYFNGQFLEQQDFRDEQDYHVDRQRRHNRLLHTFGIAEGLEVDAPANAGEIKVAAGTALDGLGRQIVLTAQRTLPLGSSAGKTVLVVISYDEQGVLPAQVGNQGEMTRLEEHPQIGLVELGDAETEDLQIRLGSVVVSQGGAVVSFDPSVRRTAGPRLPAGVVTGAALADGAVTTNKIADGSVSGNKLANNAVTTTGIADSSVTTAKIVDQAVTTAKIADLGVTAAKIADLGVTAAKIADTAVTTNKIADLGVTAAKIANLGVTTAKIADLGVTAAKIADLGVTSGKIADLAVTGSKLSLNAVTTDRIADSSVTTPKLVDNVITTAKIADSNVTAAKLASNAVTAVKIADLNVTTAKIADSNVTGAKIADATINEVKLDAATRAKLGGGLGSGGVINGDLTLNGFLWLPSSRVYNYGLGESDRTNFTFGPTDGDGATRSITTRFRPRLILVQGSASFRFEGGTTNEINRFGGVTNGVAVCSGNLVVSQTCTGPFIQRFSGGGFANYADEFAGVAGAFFQNSFVSPTGTMRMIVTVDRVSETEVGFRLTRTIVAGSDQRNQIPQFLISVTVLGSFDVPVDENGNPIA